MMTDETAEEDAMGELIPQGSPARRPIEPARTFDEFVRQFRALLEGTAGAKGYSTAGVDGDNPLFEFIQEIAGPGHAVGEIIYKGRRYVAKRNPEDLLKIAAWAWLLWRHHEDRP